VENYKILTSVGNWTHDHTHDRQVITNWTTEIADEIKHVTCPKKLCDKMLLLSQVHTVDDKNGLGRCVTHFVNKNKIYGSSKWRTLLSSFSFDPWSISQSDKTARFYGLNTHFYSYFWTSSWSKMSAVPVDKSSSPDWSENYYNFPHYLWFLLSDYRGKWFGAHYNQEVRCNSAVKCKKGPQVLTSLLNQRLNNNNYYCYKYAVRNN